ncbi:MAG: hypothetical protein PHF86_11760 [Candidatus Nanoarchaeia archaeon]|jgi:hypothetical protein|nr:hypothetical protein [Candidatus Nanoarchaeia archaeon]
MGQLHELLAVESDIKDVFTKILDETAKTFNQKSSHFQESRKSYHPLKDDDKDLPDEEFVPMVTTVAAKLSYAQDHFIRMIDAVLQKERANQLAAADVIVEMSDGTVKTIIEKAPVIFLVQMENVLDRIRKVYAEIPTLDPAKTWNKDKTKDGIWVADPVKRVRTKKVYDVLVKLQPTKEHPGQADTIQVDAVVGEWTHATSSGALSPKQKSQLLDHIDRLLAGVKIARAKANGIDVESARIGAAFFNFVNEGVEI